MEVKPGDFNLISGWHKQEIVPGIRVCYTSKRKTLGILVNILSHKRRYPRNPESELVPDELEVFWQTGSNAGKNQIVEAGSLINYDAYKQTILDYIIELEAIEKIANKTGL